MRRKNPRRVAPMFQMKKGETTEDALLRGAELRKPLGFGVTQEDRDTLNCAAAAIAGKPSVPFVKLVEGLDETLNLKTGVAREFLAVYRTDPALAERVVEGDVALRSAYERVRAMSLLKWRDGDHRGRRLRAWAMILFSDTLALVELARLWRGDPGHGVVETPADDSEALEWAESNGVSRYADPRPQFVIDVAWRFIITPADNRRIRTKYPSELETLVWTKVKAVVKLLREYDVIASGGTAQVVDGRDVLITQLEKRVGDLESRFAELERNVRKPLTDSVEVPARPADALTESEVAFLRGFARSR